MGIMDSIKSKVGGNKQQAKQVVDKAADVVADKAGAHADKVEQGAEMAKDAIDTLPDA
jgi:gas vesicle protein